MVPWKCFTRVRHCIRIMLVLVRNPWRQRTRRIRRVGGGGCWPAPGLGSTSRPVVGGAKTTLLDVGGRGASWGAWAVPNRMARAVMVGWSYMSTAEMSVPAICPSLRDKLMRARESKPKSSSASPTSTWPGASPNCVATYPTSHSSMAAAVGPCVPLDPSVVWNSVRAWGGPAAAKARGPVRARARLASAEPCAAAGAVIRPQSRETSVMTSGRRILDMPRVLCALSAVYTCRDCRPCARRSAVSCSSSTPKAAARLQPRSGSVAKGSTGAASGAPSVGASTLKKRRVPASRAMLCRVVARAFSGAQRAGARCCGARWTMPLRHCRRGGASSSGSARVQKLVPSSTKSAAVTV
mmetsp:Transcript_52956/g.94468  ORF Transcript_52956/g.94468 Transcript_52956/m.94468 type:complete len:353 (-) Transcript_52956:7027-8085(-)